MPRATEAVDVLRAQLDRAEAGKEAADRHADQERSRADAAVTRADRADARAEAAQQAADELRHANAARRALGRVAGGVMGAEA